MNIYKTIITFRVPGFLRSHRERKSEIGKSELDVADYYKEIVTEAKKMGVYKYIEDIDIIKIQ